MAGFNDTRKEFEVTLGKWLEDVAQFVFAKSQENLTKALEWERGARGMRPSIITDTGELLQSGSINVIGQEATISYDAPHASFIEFGTEPHWPPLEPLVRWCMRKLGKSEGEAKRMARRIQLTIAHHGSDPHPFLRSAIREAEEKFG